MDFCRNISVSSGHHSDYHQPEQQLLSPSCSKLDSSLDDLFSGHPLEEGDVNLEWLSIFVEDCLSSSGSVNCPCPPPAATCPSPQITTCDTTNSVANNGSQLVKDTASLLEEHKLVIPGKARSKRKRSHSNCILGGRGTTTPFMSRRRSSCWSQAHQFFMNPPQAQAQDLALTSDPPLLQQAYWLADSELIFPPKKEEEENDHPTNYTSSSSRKEFRGDGDDQEVVVNKQLGRKKKKQKKKVNDNSNLMMMGVEGREEEEEEERHGNSSGGIRRCSHCLSQRTPQWRGGPLGPKTLCNACGVRYKSGRLLPEYRPAKSPTFVSYIHSNSHKKVLEMRTLSHSSL